MNIKQAVSTILSKYGLTLEDEVKTEMGEAVLEDGTKVYCSGTFGVGETCYVVNEEGEQIALPDGEYKLQDGGSFTIEEGKISASTVKQEEAPAEKTETKEEEEEEMVHTPDHKEDEEYDHDEDEKKKMEDEDEEEKMGDKKTYHRRHDMLSKEQAREMLAEVGAELRKEHAAEIKALKEENAKLVARLEKQEGIKRVAEKKDIPEAVKTYMSSTQASANQIFNQYSR
jgi:hypothetical protein